MQHLDLYWYAALSIVLAHST